MSVAMPSACSRFTPKLRRKPWSVPAGFGPIASLIRKWTSASVSLCSDSDMGTDMEQPEADGESEQQALLAVKMKVARWSGQ